MAGWVFLSFFNIKQQQLILGFKTRNLWFLFLFFVVTVISAVLSSNKSEGFFSVEVKLGLISFPYLLFCFEWPLEILKRCIVSFVSGCFFACIYLITRAFYFSVNGHPEYFFYTLFSDLIHASYFAMYLVMALTIVILFYRQWFSTQKTIMFSAYFFAAVFVVTIFLCSSKLGIISFFICAPLILLYKLWEKLNVKTVTMLVVLTGILLIVGFKLFPESFARLKSITETSSSPDKTSSESTAVRLLIWEQAIMLIKENFLFGTGVGDVNDDLYRAYEEHGIAGAFEHKLNAHNQFFQTFIGIGVIGFVLLFI